MAETKKSAIARNTVISRAAELDICSVRPQSGPSRAAVQQALISSRNHQKKLWNLNGFRVFSCPKISDGFSWRSMVFDRFFIVNEGLTAVFRAYIINKRDRWGRELDIEVRCMLKDRVDYINESIYNV